MSSTEVVKKKKKETRVKLKEDQEAHFDLRREMVFSNYCDPLSETYNNALKSAVKAGYTKNS